MDPALAELLRDEDAAGSEVEAIVRLRPAAELPTGRLIARFGDIATCRLDAGTVRTVRAHPDVISLKAARAVGPEREPPAYTHDADEQGVCATDVRRRPELSLTGTGVVVGVVDWGADFDHPSLKADGRTTRFLAIWDQRRSVGVAPPRPYGYGRVMSAAEIDAALASPSPYRTLRYHPGEADAGGGTHGTHVLDIAAGNGRGGGPPGVAPEAALVFVHLADRDTGGLANLGDSVRLLEAVDFIRRTAGDRPWVVNLSLGRHGGPHDGSTLTELAFDALLAEAPGRFIVQSAGNYFRSRTHARGALGTGEVRLLTFSSDPGDTSQNELEIWYAGDDELDVAMRPPGGAASAPVPAGEMVALRVGDREVGRLYHRAGDPNNAANHVDAFLAPLAGAWTVTLHGRRMRHGRFDAWLERDERCPGCQARFIAVDATRTTTTGTIANGHLPLVVGAYDAHHPEGPPAASTSAGPTRDDRDKPDVSAPGVGVVAARSAPRHAAQGFGAVTRKSGSSMATPHVTGAVALCLQAAPDLGAAELRALVMDSASPPVTAEPRLGRGRLDLERLIAALLARKPAPPQRRHHAMEPDLDSAYGLALAPAAAYRDLLYRPATTRLADRFEIVARPGERFVGTPRAGDIVLGVTLGQREGGSCAVVLEPGLKRRRASGSGGMAGWYAMGAPPGVEDRDMPVRVLDVGRRVPIGRLLLRPRAPDSETAAEHDFGEFDADLEPHDALRDPVPVDVEAAVPAFSATERRNVVRPLLPAQRAAEAIEWGRRVHPATSGVTLGEIRHALRAYVDPQAVQATLGASDAAGDDVLVECVHQFQVKCYVDAQAHDGRVGESTLDSLGLIAREGTGMRTSDRSNPNAQHRLQRRDAALKRATGDEFSAANWFSRMADPSVFGLRTKTGSGVNVVLLRKLRRAERHLLSLPAFAGKTPVQLASALRIEEKHGGARPSQTQSTSVHTFGLAIDIAYLGNPWVRASASWSALQRAALLISRVRLGQTSAPAYFSSLGTDASRSTGQLWDELRQRSSELSAYFALRDDAAALRSALEAAERAGMDVMRAGEPVDDAVRRWRDRIRDDRAALRAGDFDGHLPPERGFLTHARDLVIALRDHGCLAWGAVDLGPGASGSGDIMHFDARVDGAGLVLSENTQAFIPSVHPCLVPAGATSPPLREPETVPGDAQEWWPFRFPTSAPAAPATDVRVRRNITTLSTAERATLLNAIKELKRRRVYHEFVRDHANSMGNAHRQPAFLPWHRQFILIFETELRAIDASITLPYWDWAADLGSDSSGTRTWNTAMVALLGGDGSGPDDAVTSGPLAGWTVVNSTGADTPMPLQRDFGGASWARTLPTGAEVTAALAITPYDAGPWNDAATTGGFRNDLEGWARANHLHNVVHGWVGGSMLPGSSPNDPCFFLHHCFVDKIWADWQAAHPRDSYLPGTRQSRGAGATEAWGLNDDVAVFRVTSASPITYKASQTLDLRNLRDHKGATGIQVRYA